MSSKYTPVVSGGAPDSRVVAVEADEDERPRLNVAEWMSHLPERLWCVPLNKLAIPGSHDSGAYSFNPQLPIAPDEPWFISVFSMFCKGAVARIVGNWGRTQRLDITSQLNNGVRYLDMRAAYLKSHDDFFFVHGLYGRRISELLQELVAFLDKHPREVVIVDFNHQYNMDDNITARFEEMVLHILGEKLFPETSKTLEPVMKLSLQDIWKTKKQIIAVGYEDEKTKLWSPTLIYSKWFNTDNVNTLLRNLDHHFAKLHTDSLNVFQAILSPQTGTIIKHTWSSLEKYLALKCNDAVMKWLEKVYATRQKGVNIVISDFVTSNDIPQYVIRLNDLLLLHDDDAKKK